MRKHQSLHMKSKLEKENEGDSIDPGNAMGSQSLVEGKQQYTCEICGIDTFTEKREFTEHFFRHEKENLYRFFKFAHECDKCSENFALKEDMLEHTSICKRK